MRRQWYLGFSLLLLLVLAIFLMSHTLKWFILLLIPLVVLGFYDVVQTKHSILRNFPILGHVRYFLEFIRPEIQQYLIASDEDDYPLAAKVVL